MGNANTIWRKERAFLFLYDMGTKKAGHDAKNNCIAQQGDMGEAKLSRLEKKRKKKIAGSRTALDVGVGKRKKSKRKSLFSFQAV